MRRRRNNSEESSLELLLDTMCNTFGGVMFIAISIFIIIYGFTQTEIKEEVPAIDPIEIEQEIVNLKNILKELQSQIETQNQEVSIRKSLDLSDQIREVALMEELLKKQQKQSTVLQTALNAIKPLLDKHQATIVAQQKITSNNIAAIRQLDNDIVDMSKKLQELKNHKVASVKMNFKLITSSNKAPYFIIFKDHDAYPVGPIKANNLYSYETHPAVSSIQKTDNTGATGVYCTPRITHAIKVLENDRLSHNFIKMLQDIPSNRVPLFFVPPGSAETASKMRERLKRQDLQHGVKLADNDDETFVFYFTRNAEYEY